jgi:hypothetical protein
MLGGDVYDLTRTGPLSLEEANNLVGVLNRVTQKYSLKVNALIARLERLNPIDRAQTGELEAEVTKHIEEWNAQIRKLHGVPKGLWLVDIDAGDGYYCWKFPETHIGFWHEYKSGYAGRISLAEREKKSVNISL